MLLNKEMAQEIVNNRKKEDYENHKMIKELSKQSKMNSNREMYDEHEPKSRTCNLYSPCPICFKCQNKASHLYVRCQTCEIPICTHKYKDREFMIRRDNFRLHLSEESKKHFSDLDK